MYKSLHHHRATELSGNPQAWPDFMGWATHHHTSLMNATISCFLHQGEPFPVATEKYFLLVSVAYRNDPTLPRERQFEMRGAHWSQKSDPSLSQVAPFVDMGRVNAVEIGKIIDLGALPSGRQPGSGGRAPVRQALCHGRGAVESCTGM